MNCQSFVGILSARTRAKIFAIRVHFFEIQQSSGDYLLKNWQFFGRYERTTDNVIIESGKKSPAKAAALYRQKGLIVVLSIE